MTEISQARALTQRIAAYGLSEDEAPIVVHDREWRSLMVHIKTQRLSGIAWAALNTGVLPLEESQAEDLRALHVENMMWTLELERALLGIARAAEDEGVDLIVLKGPALAHRFYPDPSWRAFSDIDLLVRTSDWRRACLLLERRGFQRELPEPRAGFDERFGKAAVHANSNGLNVDLHRALVLGAFGFWIKPEELFERTTPFKLAGVTLKCLDDTALLLHACVHASLGFMDPLLVPLRDLIQVAELGDVDWDEFGRLAARWRLRAVVRHAFQTAEQVLGVESPAELLTVTGGGVSRRERRALDSYVTPMRDRGGTVRSSLRAVPGARNKAGLLRAMLFPDQAFLSARAGAIVKPSYVRRWSVAVRWLLRRTR